MHRLITIVTLAALAIGCSSNSRELGRRNDANLQTQRDLAQSGFQMEMLDTPVKFDMAREMPQNRVVQRVIGGDIHYVYVDISLCGCMYTGGQAAYERYRSYVQSRSIQQSNQRAEQLYSESTRVPSRYIGRED